MSLNNVPIFKGIEEVEIEALLEKVVFQRKSYPKGSLIALQGEDYNRLLILLSGTVKGEMTDMSGKSLKIEDITAPATLATAFIFGQKSVLPVNITASENVEMIAIPRAELLKIFALNSTVLQNFLGMISSRAQFLSEKLRFHSFRSLKAKLAYYLVSEAGNSTSFKMKQSQNQLAELFGVARPSIGRMFLQLQKEKIIDVRYKNVEIINPEGLHQLFMD